VLEGVARHAWCNRACPEASAELDMHVHVYRRLLEQGSKAQVCPAGSQGAPSIWGMCCSQWQAC
jgi:hypothetical protein